MHYTFQAHTFPTREDAVSVFHAINAEMQELLPDAFVTVREAADHEYEVLFGCSDNDEDFIEHIEPFVAGCRSVNIDISVWMAMEANHSLIKQQHSEVFPKNLFAFPNSQGAAPRNPLDRSSLTALSTQHQMNARRRTTNLLSDITQTHLLSAKMPRQRSLFNIQMRSQWDSSDRTLHQWSLLERCAHPLNQRGV